MFKNIKKLLELGPMGFISRWLVIREANKQDLKRIRENSWLEEYSKEMKQTLKGDVFEDE